MEDQELQAKLAGYTNDELTPVGMIPHTSYAYPPCEGFHRRVQVDKKDFSWDPEGGPIYADGSACDAMYPESPQKGQQWCTRRQSAQSSVYCIA